MTTTPPWRCRQQPDLFHYPIGGRFRKSFKIALGVRLNVSKRGLGVSAGVRGARVGVGPRGAYVSGGIPGTGLYYHEYLRTSKRGSGRSSKRRSGTTSAYQTAGELGEIVLRLHDDGHIQYLDASGAEVPPKVANLFVNANAELIRGWLETQCEHWNPDIQQILSLHLDTPPPVRGVALPPPEPFLPKPFTEPAPTPPAPLELTFWNRLLKSRGEQQERDHQTRRRRYEAAYQAWTDRKQAHETAQTAARAAHEGTQAQIHQLHERAQAANPAQGSLRYPASPGIHAACARRRFPAYWGDLCRVFPRPPGGALRLQPALRRGDGVDRRRISLQRLHPM